MQDNGEKPSAYLQRLQATRNTAFRRGGVPAGDLDCQLLKRFIRGCWNNILISELQLEQKKQNPSTFAELLLLLRTAETKTNLQIIPHEAVFQYIKAESVIPLSRCLFPVRRGVHPLTVYF